MVNKPHLQYRGTKCMNLSRDLAQCRKSNCKTTLPLELRLLVQALGIAAASLDCAVNYATERKSFGEPISGLYAIQVRQFRVLSFPHFGRASSIGR